jgi:hypothetical protein
MDTPRIHSEGPKVFTIRSQRVLNKPCLLLPHITPIAPERWVVPRSDPWGGKDRHSNAAFYSDVTLQRLEKRRGACLERRSVTVEYVAHEEPIGGIEVKTVVWICCRCTLVSRWGTQVTQVVTKKARPVVKADSRFGGRGKGPLVVRGDGGRVDLAIAGRVGADNPPNLSLEIRRGAASRTLTNTMPKETLNVDASTGRAEIA